MKRILTYPLWGSSKLYVEGCIQNISLAYNYYPDFIVRVYCASNCPGLPVLQKMQEDYPLEIVEKSPADTVWGSTTNVQEHANPLHTLMTWRYEAIFDKEVEVWITRDTDSRISERESAAVYEWLQTGLGCHCIFEREVHIQNGPMPGMSGLRTKYFQNNSLEDYLRSYQQFYNWYQIEGYAKGLRNVHLDLWIFKEFFYRPLAKIGQVYYSGHGTPNPLKIPIDPQAGEVGSTVNESWRYESFKC
jgi:hypothetical protein